MLGNVGELSSAFSTVASQGVFSESSQLADSSTGRSKMHQKDELGSQLRLIKMQKQDSGISSGQSIGLSSSLSRPLDHRWDYGGFFSSKQSVNSGALASTDSLVPINAMNQRFSTDLDSIDRESRTSGSLGLPHMRSRALIHDDSRLIDLRPIDEAPGGHGELMYLEDLSQPLPMLKECTRDSPDEIDQQQQPLPRRTTDTKTAAEIQTMSDSSPVTSNGQTSSALDLSQPQVCKTSMSDSRPVSHSLSGLQQELQWPGLRARSTRALERFPYLAYNDKEAQEMQKARLQAALSIAEAAERFRASYTRSSSRTQQSVNESLRIELQEMTQAISISSHEQATPNETQPDVTPQEVPHSDNKARGEPLLLPSTPQNMRHLKELGTCGRAAGFETIHEMSSHPTSGCSTIQDWPSRVTPVALRPLVNQVVEGNEGDSCPGPFASDIIMCTQDADCVLRGSGGRQKHKSEFQRCWGLC